MLGRLFGTKLQIHPAVARPQCDYELPSRVLTSSPSDDVLSPEKQMKILKPGLY